MNGLLESYSDIRSYVNHLSSKVIELRKYVKPDDIILLEIDMFYKNTILEYMDNEILHNLPTSKKAELEIKNQIFQTVAQIDIYIKELNK